MLGMDYQFIISLIKLFLVWLVIAMFIYLVYVYSGVAETNTKDIDSQSLQY